MKRVLKVFGVAAFVWLGISCEAFSYTSTDYYNAGLQFYNSKNYDQAIQYFGAALSMDPNNAAALQGRGNCYYAQGRQPEALADYQKALALNPSDAQLSQFVQSLQAQAGNAPAVTAPAAAAVPAPAVSGALEQGVALYQQQQYQAAIPQFQQAVHDNPNNANAYYYLGMAQVMTGDSKNAVVAFSICNQKQPNPTVEAYVNQMKSRLSPEDQQWVNTQIASSATAGAGKPPATAKSMSFGARLAPAISMLNLADLNTHAETLQKMVKLQQSTVPTTGFDASVPEGCPNIGLEPVVRFGQNLEVGLSLGIMPVGTAKDSVTDVSKTYTYDDSLEISAFSIGANVRYFFMTGDFQPFLCAGGMVMPININAKMSMADSASVTTIDGTFSGTGAGGQIQAGLDWHLGENFVVTPFAGYQFATANSFTGSFTAVIDGSTQNYSGELVMEPSSQGEKLSVISTGYTTPAGTRSLKMDLSGVKGGLQICAFF